MLIALLIIRDPPFHLLIMLIVQVLYRIRLSRGLSILLSLYLILFFIFQSLRFSVLHEFIIFLLVHMFQRAKWYLSFRITTVLVVTFLLVYSLLTLPNLFSKRRTIHKIFTKLITINGHFLLLLCLYNCHIQLYQTFAKTLHLKN